MANPLSPLDSFAKAMTGGLDALKGLLLNFTQQGRLVTIDLGAAGTGFVVEQARGTEGLECLDSFEVDVLSSSAHLELKTLIGAEAGLAIVCADGSQRHWYGLVSKASARGADGGLARYRLSLSPWPVLLGLREDSFVFQDQTTLDTVEALLADYGLARYELRVSDATRAALPRHAIRTQYRETDLAFLQRLLAADGLSFWFEHDQAAASGTGALRHTLVIADAESDWADLSPASIRYHRMAATESADTIHGFVAARQVRTQQVSRSGWNAALVSAPSGEDSATPGSEAAPMLEDFDGGIDAGRADLSAGVAARIAGLRLLAHQADGSVFTGESSVRTLAPGKVFELTDHPDFGSLITGQPPGRFKLRRITHTMSNNLRTGLEASKDFGERGTYTNTFSCVPAEVLLAPQPKAAPAAPGLLTALVTGVSGESATSHRNHEVRIQFHFQRGAAPNPGGLTETGWDTETGVPGNAPGNEASGTWVRVAQALAGPDWGMVFVPRIGSEVLVAFEHGDLDRPIIVGSLHNGVDLPPFQAGADSGVDHPGVISGIHTQVLMAAGSAGATGYNQLLLDDAQGALGTQLASSTQASQLNLGALVQRSPGTATRGSARGEGAELATDGWAVLRAGQGALLSATTRAGAVSNQLDASEALAQMAAAGELAKALSDAAVAQGAPALCSPKDVDAFSKLASATVPAQGAKAGGKSIPAFSAPILLQETPASAVLASTASIVSFASQSLHLTAQDHAHLAAGKTIELASGTDTALFTHAGGITAIAANGPVSIQAQTDALSLMADKSVSVTSTDGKIEVFAQTKIVLQAGQCSITLDGGDITFAMPGLFSVKGAQHVLSGGGSAPAALPEMPTGVMPKANMVIERLYHDNEPLVGAPYRATLADGSIREGVLDGSGRAILIGVPPASAVDISFGPMPGRWERKDQTPTPDHKPTPSNTDIDALIDKYASTDKKKASD